MANYQLSVQKRESVGTSNVRRMRADKQIPAIVYGSGKPAMTIQVQSRDLEKALAASGSLIDLQFGDGSKTVIVKEVQNDPVRGDVIHVDFHEVDLSKKLETTVPVRVINEEQRPSDGGVVGTLLWELRVACLPADIPESITVDVSGLELGSTVLVGDLEAPQGVEILDDADEAVVKVDIPQMAEEEETEEEAELGEEGEEDTAEPEAEEEE